jgi:hypothetical protein
MEVFVFERCIDIADVDVKRALVSPDSFGALIARAAEVSRPSEGGPKVIGALAKLATPDCTWLDGALHLELAGDDRATRVVVARQPSGGPRVPVFPPFELNVPYDEFVRAFKLYPKLIAPLHAIQRGGRLLLSTAPADDRPSRHPTVARMGAVRPEMLKPEVHNRPTVARMAAIRLEDMPQARREDQADIDDAWTGDDESKKKK